MNSNPSSYIVEFEESSALGALMCAEPSISRSRRADLQIVVARKKASIRDIAATLLASLGLAETGPSATTASAFLAAVLFSTSGIVDLKFLKGWSVDDLIDQWEYDKEIEQFYIQKAALKKYVDGGNIGTEFVEWLVDAGALIDDADRFRVNKLFKKGNIVNII